MTMVALQKVTNGNFFSRYLRKWCGGYARKWPTRTPQIGIASKACQSLSDRTHLRSSRGAVIPKDFEPDVQKLDGHTLLPRITRIAQEHFIPDLETRGKISYGVVAIASGSVGWVAAGSMKLFESS